MQIGFVLLVVAVGMVLPAQAGINAEFRRHVGHPLLAGVLNFLVGLVALAVVTAAMRIPLPAAGRMLQAPWWAWTGGLCGATLVVSAVVAAPRLGALLLVACLVTGQLVASVVIDHFAWFGFDARPINWERIAGIAFLIVGVLLVQRAS